MLPGIVTQVEIIPSKRKRVVLPVETKLQIIERVMNGEAFTKLSAEYGIGAQTVRDIFHNKDKLVNFAFNSGTVGGSLKRKSLKRSSFQDIDKAVFQWFQQQRAEGIPITGPMLIEKALWFHKEMKISEPFLASSGWLSKFKTRYNIRQPKTKDDKLIADEPVVDKFKTDFKQIVRENNFTVDQIYIADEKMLHWKIIPNESNLKFLDNSHFKLISEENDNCNNISIMACVNSNGSKKLKLFCTGNSNILINSNHYSSSLVNYYVTSHENSYEDVLKYWFNNVFIPEVTDDLKEKFLPEKGVLLIIDNNNNSENNIQIKSDNGNFFIIFLPQNLSELPQMSQSSMDIIKNYFKKKLTIVSEENINNNNILDFYNNWSLNDTFCILSDLWNNIKIERMQHTSWWWRNLFSEMENEGIIEPSEDITTHFMTTKENIKAEAQNNDLISDKINICYEQTDYKLMNNNDLTAFHGIVNEAEELGKQQIDQNNEFSSASSTQSKMITINDALSCAGTLLTYLEQQEDSSYNDILIVKNIKKKLKEKLNDIFLNNF